MAKRKFSKLPSNVIAYAGSSKVVVTVQTPVCLVYETKSQRVTMSFYIQRYDHKDVAVDAALQSKLNGE